MIHTRSFRPRSLLLLTSVAVAAYIGLRPTTDDPAIPLVRAQIQDAWIGELVAFRKRGGCPKVATSQRVLDQRVDPWGRDLRVICDDRHGVTVITAGPDGQFRTADDVRSPWP